MTLEEFTKAVSGECQESHLFMGIGSGGAVLRVKSVSVRRDDDGLLSVVLHPDYTPNRFEKPRGRGMADVGGLGK